MSVEAMAVVLHHSRAKGTAKLILLGIANHEGDGGAWPSIETLAKYANVDVRSVQRALRTLEEMREVRTDIRAGGTLDMVDAHRPNRYVVTLRCPALCDGSSQHRMPQDALFGVPPGVVTLASPGGADVTRGGDADVTRGGDAGVTRTTHLNQHFNQDNLAVAKSDGSARETEPVDNHDCQRGWLGEDDAGMPVPCPKCKPRLRSVR